MVVVTKQRTYYTLLDSYSFEGVVIKAWLHRYGKSSSEWIEDVKQDHKLLW